ncbi:ribonuclease Y [Candidatus Berkelbacteria bacterium CG10_big_fil_rev_8_21_14_0_10_43_13]|uniref:Ribonuclease Y n=1 Tax=Candidatus Berkelbacteria bacterium CG10_big_fil_rev_8_21_14_0_10_43_13 TaxID=1974514 RepID=A0A2H0W6P0_9BACT|nr:MAG: ribonuclease Y [Candidatus Berkelbacteria bacterium CG10_big_fil_rev_8_21_14_0_10_43_13]
MLESVLVTLVALIAGGFLGFYINRLRAKNKVSNAEVRAEKEIEEAKTKAKEIVLEGKNEALKEREIAQKELSEKNRQLEKIESDLRRREASVDSRYDSIEVSRKDTEKKQKEIEEIKQTLRDLRKKQEDSLERIAKMTKDDAKKVLLDLVEKEGKEDLVKKIKEVDEYVRDSADEKAKEIIIVAMQRIAAETAAESTVSTIQIPNDEMKGRIIGREGRNIQAFEKITGVDLIIDDTPDAVVISSFDPVRREVAKVTLAELVGDGRIHPARIEEAFEKAKKLVAADIKKSGEEAAYEVGVTGLPVEILKVLGRLKYRTSFGQNQLQHAIEVARFCALLAEEIGANVTLSKKAGLLHDLGKAVDHEVPGSHAVISADIMRKFNLPKDLIHAVEAHHEDVPMETPEAAIVQIADAISSARPGARRESFELHIKRLEDLERVSNSFPGVEKAYAIQAGREVRILVRPEEVDDLTSAKLAKEIAKKVEEEVQYPGQVKIQVIRELRTVEYAK